jgi:hypothetical protein
MWTAQPFPFMKGSITPEWLTLTLRASGALRSARVARCSTETLAQGVGFVGQIVRLILEYDEQEAGAPSTLVAKFSSPYEAGRRTAALMGLYAREVGFYRTLAGSAGIGTARCYFAEVTADGTCSLLLLEDLRDGHFGDQVTGCTVDEARVALTEIARFHAAWWNNASLGRFPWISNSADVSRRTITAAYDALWPVFRSRFEGSLPPVVLERGPSCGTRMLAMLDRNGARSTVTLRHSDFRVDNVFFPASGTPPLVVVDWQGALRAWSGAYDAVYFLATGMPVEVRRQYGESLLRLYYDTLVESGVRDYPRDMFETDCRDGLLAAFTIIGVIAGGLVDIVNARAVDLFTAVSSRLFAALDDADAWNI